MTERSKKNRRFKDKPTDKLSQLPPGYELVTTFEFGIIMYQHYGKGIVSYPGAGYIPKYVCFPRLNAIGVDAFFVEACNPAEVVITYPLVDGDVKGIWATTKVKSSHYLANLRLILPETFLAGNKEVTYRFVVP